VWVLTGDKQETAINIAYSCRLFSTDMEVIKLNARSRDAAESSLSLYLDQCKNSTLSSEKRALVVDGKTLIYILDKRANIQHLFLNLTKMCSAVLACRATPLQKAYLVRIVKEVLKMHTLAIGDGANDVSMIQTADIGVGISGQEGMQAVMASDFAITRFRFIERLLLVHGHWCYDRLARMVLHFFYKNAAFVFVCFWFQLYCGFSGQVMIDQMYLMLFNLFFTSLPPVAVGVFDRDAPADLLSSSPQLYSVGRLSTVYKPHSFWINMADALYQSLVVFFVAFGAFNGGDIGLWEFGTLLCSQCILVMLIQLGVETKSWTIFHWMAMLVSIALYLGFGLTYNAVCSNCAGLTNPYWVMQHGLMEPVQYLVLVITAVLSTLPRVFMRAVTNTIEPTGVVTAVRLRRRERNTKKMLEQVESKTGFVKFFRSSSSDIGNSVSSSSNVESGQAVELTDTEMTNM
jgi:phospholipid-translocating ATPase